MFVIFGEHVNQHIWGVTTGKEVCVQSKCVSVENPRTAMSQRLSEKQIHSKKKKVDEVDS